MNPGEADARPTVETEDYADEEDLALAATALGGARDSNCSHDETAPLDEQPELVSVNAGGR